MLLIICCVLVVQSYVGAECPRIISKNDWDGTKTMYGHFLNPPTDLVVILHTVTQACSDDTSCAEIVRDLQKVHKEEAQLYDIGPSFLIAGTGKVYEGRGWNRVGIHTPGFNNQSIGIAFIGSFNNQEPTEKALDVCQALIKCGVDKKRLTDDYKLVIHSQLIPTESPGKKLASKVKLWDNFIKDVTAIKNMADFKVLMKEPEGKQESRNNDDRGLILTEPRKIDFLTNIRDGIKELIDNLHKTAIQTLDTTETLTRSVASVASKFFETFGSTMNNLKNLFTSNISKVTGTPGVGKCVKEIQGKANTLYSKTDSSTRDCADRKIDQINAMVQQLGAAASDAINFSNTAVENTKNCTELNYGIEANTKSCLNSVTKQTQSYTNSFQALITNSLNSIKSTIDTLPDQLYLCSEKPVMDATAESTKLISSLPGCTASKAVADFTNFFSFGN